MGDQIIAWGAVSAAVMAIAALLFAVWRRAVQPAALRIRGVFGRLENGLALVEKELSPNGGESIRDVVGGLRASMAFERAWAEAAACAMGIGKWQSDTAGRTVAVNLGLCRMVDRSRDDFIGWGWINTIHEEERDAVRQAWLNAVADGRQWSMEYRLIAPCGDQIHVRANAFPVLDGQRLIGYTGSVVPIEARGPTGATGAKGAEGPALERWDAAPNHRGSP